ncbi:unnamed protein product [Rotaria socialis]|uniref:LamG domain-containing protein n=1 Tax=Rotaria socialis TaxID=392032 RepID=A0A821AUU8_9BILA|nr:unnamed protein product [Rotaria socialis]
MPSTNRHTIFTFRYFDPWNNNLQHLYNNFPGVGINGPSYNSPDINGCDSCIYLNASTYQSINILTPPFLNMAYASFTLRAWFDQDTQDHFLHIGVRNQRIYIGFYNDNTQGYQTLLPYVWYHMAYIYDYLTLTQYVYINGVLDAPNSPRRLYKGTAGNMIIGTNKVFFPLNYWNDCIDQVCYFSRAKKASEILSNVTLNVAYTFNNILLDSGSLGINGTGTSLLYTTSGLVLLDTSINSYSKVIWITSTATTAGAIIHVASTTIGISWSIQMLDFINTGNLGAQGCSTSGSTPLTEPTVPINAWTHVAITYESSNGLRLWMNGTLFVASASSCNYSATDVPVTLTMDASLSSAAGSCTAGIITTGQYFGFLDEFKLFSRELSLTEVSSLVNP